MPTYSDIFLLLFTYAVLKPPTSHQGSAHNSARGTPHLSPRLTPSGSPKRQSARTSPRRSMSSSENSHRISLPSSKPTSQSTTAPNSPPSSGSMPCTFLAFALLLSLLKRSQVSLLRLLCNIYQFFCSCLFNGIQNE